MSLKSNRGLTPYPYTNLPTPTSIRILKVLPREQNWKGRISITLEVVNLKDNPQYTALSYTWGNPCTVFTETEDDEIPSAETAAQASIDIICNGYYIKVTKNCHEFLKVVQRVGKLVTTSQYARWLHGRREADNLVPDDMKYFWIDAICINQVSIPERSAQVSIMRDIYDKAGLVLIWLGSKDVFSDEAIDVLETIANVNSSKLTLADPLALGETFLNVKFYDCLDIPIIHARQWQSVFAFLERSWFVRGWVIQEISLARRAMVLCGTRCFSVRILLIATSALDSLGIMSSLAFMNQEGYARAKAGAFVDADDFNNELQYDTFSTFPGLAGKGGSLSRPSYEATSSQDTNRNMINMSDRRKLILTTHPRSTAGQLPFLMGLWQRFSDPSLLQPRTPRQRAESVSMPLQFLLYLCDNALFSRLDDKVYAFIGIAAESCWASFPIDYARPVAETYTLVTRQMMRVSRSVRVLSLCPDQCRRKLTDLPSWVPDFSIERVRHALDNGFDQSMGTFSPLCFDASRGLEWHEDISEHLCPLLSVEAIYCATVSARATIKPSLYGEAKRELFFELLEYGKTTQCTIEELVKAIAAFDAVCVASDPNYPSLETVIEIFKTHAEQLIFGSHINMVTSGNNLPAGLDEFTLADEAFGKRFALYSGFTQPIYLTAKMMEIHVRTRDRLLAGVQSDREEVQSQKTSSNERWASDDFEIISSIFEKPPGAYTSAQLDASSRLLSAAFRDTTLFQMEKRQYGRVRIGRGPLSVLKGDEVWILAGGRVPYILRPLGNDKYEFIGEAYLEDVMYGEAVGSGSSQPQIITLE
ncbi:hypothetical protein GP486_005969 [Trichoglossum hirsutum]|uniref:Heterokaryon incompatibility domain-containing protein n=1 Tax=Trichoglossum hirsutum TaxID=265104 RepID=A0A9P8L888_9PEZI|nr:hypothetical protein GP486_005969 [Trichoglossum hirsutum]